MQPRGHPWSVFGLQRYRIRLGTSAGTPGPSGQENASRFHQSSKPPHQSPFQSSSGLSPHLSLMLPGFKQVGGASEYGGPGLRPQRLPGAQWAGEVPPRVFPHPHWPRGGVPFQALDTPVAPQGTSPVGSTSSPPSLPRHALPSHSGVPPGLLAFPLCHLVSTLP